MSDALLAGRYRILSPLGAGGMGEVFLAEDTRLERRVAVKLLPASIEADAVARERLRREALAAAALDHPFICKVYEIGDADGHVFIVMEYVEGETLHVSARRAMLPRATGGGHRARVDPSARRRPSSRPRASRPQARQRDGDAAGTRQSDGLRAGEADGPPRHTWRWA